jgi:hypothetical protein
VGVRRVPRDEDTAGPVRVGHLHPQVPEADVLDVAVEREPGGAVQQPGEVVSAHPRAPGDRGVEEELPAHVDPTEEHPVALQRRVQHAVGGPVGEAA